MIAELFSFHLVHCSYSAMDGCTAINLVKHVKIVFIQVAVVCAACHLRELSQQSNNPCIRIALCTQTQNLDKDSFDMLYKNDCWAAIPDPISTTDVPYERKINMLLSNNNNFMIFLFDFERFRIESRFLFVYAHCIPYLGTKGKEKEGIQNCK